MKKTILTTAVFLLSLIAISACGNTYDVSLYDTPVPAAPGAWPPSIFVNNTLYYAFEHRPDHVPEPGDMWVYIGDIQRTVASLLSGFPTENFQSNNGMIGARIYHSYTGRVHVTNCAWNGPLDEEVIGDSMIVVYGEWHILYLSREVLDEVVQIMNSVQKNSLLVEGVLYNHIRTEFGNHLSADNYVFLGEVEGVVSRLKLPEEDFQTNREINVDARIYRLPPEAVNDIVIIHRYGGARCYFRAFR